MTKDAVSVIIPTRRRPEFLERALRSVLAQSYAATDIIVVDDNADEPELRSRTETVVNRVRSETESETQLTLLQPIRPLGGAAARNRGAACADGEYLAFLDDDDWWLREKLDLQLKAFVSLRNTAATPGLVYTSRRIVDPEGRTKRVRLAEHRGWITETLLENNVIGTTSCAMIRRDVFEELGGFDEDLPAQQDADLWLRLAARYSIELVSQPVTVQQEHAEGRISRRFDAKSCGLEMFFKKHYGQISKRPHVLAAHSMRIGTHYLKHGRPFRGRRWMLQALFASPSSRALKRLVFGLGSRPGEFSKPETMPTQGDSR